MAKTKLSAVSLQALEVLKGKSLTASDLKDLGLNELNSAHLTALANRGLITADKVEVEVQTVVKRKVNKYTVTDKGMSFTESE
jgi:hypothetical protein